jgi:hypothetical protein
MPTQRNSVEDQDLITELWALSREVIEAQGKHEAPAVWQERRARIAELRERVRARGRST